MVIKKMMRKVLKILTWIGIAAWFVVILGFVSGEAEEVLCNRIEVVLSDTVQNRFVTESDIRSIVSDRLVWSSRAIPSVASIPGRWRRSSKKIPHQGMQK